ncbi:23S rRNA methyltransferase [Marinobacterium zhoushanense]|uniref:23S rRNA methyltransferase n=1 Tax=Marinobacterium zhoushanense TaxID=1679163 RepID=A0ABQ1K4D4_9GAMM|nr:RNA methyltransferase [Marinobacterium zhoushanense]GGB86166.1 23S rRNA methyltransferase [Marinobacterium zhoushanense]
MKKGFACIGLHNPKSPENVGNVMRAAGCYGVNSVFYTGTRYDRAKAFYTDTQKVHQRIPLIGVPELKQVVPLGARVVAVELIEGATPLMHYQHPRNAFYLFGPEDGSLSQEVLEWVDDVVYVPTTGCMNLSATVNVVLYDRLAKTPDLTLGDELIRRSRDRNNRTRLPKGETV